MSDFRIGFSWAHCDACGAHAEAEGRAATLVHVPDCPTLRWRSRAVVRSVDVERGVIVVDHEP
jgi:hypothetical protein